jgi:hypothetical protein
MTPLQLKVLWAYEQYWNKQFTIKEDLPLQSIQHRWLSLGKFVRQLVQYKYVDTIVRELRTMEVLEPGLDGGLFGDSQDTHYYLDDAKISEFGSDVLTGVSSPTAWGLYRRTSERAVSGR